MGSFWNELIPVSKLITALIICVLQTQTGHRQGKGLARNHRVSQWQGRKQGWVTSGPSFGCPTRAAATSLMQWDGQGWRSPPPLLLPSCPGELRPADLLCSGEPACCRITLARFYCRGLGTLRQLGCKPLICWATGAAGSHTLRGEAEVWLSRQPPPKAATLWGSQVSRRGPFHHHPLRCPPGSASQTPVTCTPHSRFAI